MAGLPTFGAGSTLGPFGNAGPSSASSSDSFGFNTGTVNWGGGRPTVTEAIQSVAPVLIVAALGVTALWLASNK